MNNPFSDDFESLIANISAYIGKSRCVVGCEEVCLYLAKFDDDFINSFTEVGGDINKFEKLLSEVSEINFSHRVKREGFGVIEVGLSPELMSCLAFTLKCCATEGVQAEIVDILKSFYDCKCDVCKYFALAGVSDYPSFIDNLEGEPMFSEALDEDDDYEDNSSCPYDGQPNIFGSPFGGFGGFPFGQQKKLEDFCTDLLEEVKKHPEPIVGRESEIDKTFRILCRYKKGNVIHLGEAGVGKTAITLGLAKAIVEGNVPDKLKDYKLYSLDVGALMANTKYRGDLEGRITFILKELEKKGNVILYIDEIHTIMGGDAEGALNMAQLFKTSLVGSNIRFIGATTFEEYRKTIEKDNAFARRFKVVNIVEPTQEQCKEIIKGIIPAYEDYHSVVYDEEAINSAVELSSKYISDKFLPDKAIDLIDEAGAYLSKKNNVGAKVTKDVIEVVISENCNIPKETVTTKEDKSLIFNLESNLKANVFGQDDAIKECVKAIKLSRAGLTDSNKPVASLLFVGQTGVGKTEIARQLAKSLGIDFIKYDMSEYAEQTAVNKLIGADSGFVGYEEGGRLVEDIRKHPHCVLLLDEIEKAHPSVFNVLLQVMDDARLTDNHNRVADFKNVIIIMTSNAGASGIMQKGLGFNSNDSVDFSKMDKAVEKTFSPEFRNRLTKVIILNSMNDDMAKRIAKKQLKSLVKTLEEKGVHLTYTPAVIDYCVRHGVTKEFGARPIIRVINNDIKMVLVDDLIMGNLTNCKISIHNDTVVLNK